MQCLFIIIICIFGRFNFFFRTLFPLMNPQSHPYFNIPCHCQRLYVYTQVEVHPHFGIVLFGLCYFIQFLLIWITLCILLVNQICHVFVHFTSLTMLSCSLSLSSSLFIIFSCFMFLHNLNWSSVIQNSYQDKMVLTIIP